MVVGNFELIEGLWKADAIDRMSYLEAKQVEELVVSETHVYGLLKLPLADGKRQFSAIRIDPDLAKDLSKYDIKVTGTTEQTFFKQLLS